MQHNDQQIAAKKLCHVRRGAVVNARLGLAGCLINMFVIVVILVLHSHNVEPRPQYYCWLRLRRLHEPCADALLSFFEPAHRFP